jgi:cation:H+ antiporter
MLGFVALSLLLAGRAPALLHVGLYSPLLLALYLLALRSLYAQESSRQPGDAAPGHQADAGPARHWRRFVFSAVVVLAAGSWLPVIAADLARALGVSRSFVGTVFMALVTTLPEMAVTVSALRLRALDMAIGNLLGSNLFNVVVLAVDDAAYTSGPLLAEASPVHAGTAVTAMVMCGLVMVGLLMRPRGRVLRLLSWISVGLLATYLLNAVLVYLHGV